MVLWTFPYLVIDAPVNVAEGGAQAAKGVNKPGGMRCRSQHAMRREQAQYGTHVDK